MSNIILNPRFESWKLTPEHAALFVGAALFLTILSPFGTDSNLTLTLRFLYWFGVIFGGTAIALTVSKLFQRQARLSRGFGYALVMSIQVLAASIPITLLVAGMEMWLRDPLNWAQLPQVFGYVVTITVAITAASSFVERHRALTEKIGDDQTSNESQLRSRALLAITRFHLRLDPVLRHEEILVLKADDHYLHVGTSKGTALIRCTLAAALDELGALDGQRVHRSFWVARSAILTINRHGNAYRIIMKDGKAVPLSRRRYSELSKCDWLPV